MLNLSRIQYDFILGLLLVVKGTIIWEKHGESPSDVTSMLLFHPVSCSTDQAQNYLITYLAHQFDKKYRLLLF